MTCPTVFAERAVSDKMAPELADRIVWPTLTHWRGISAKPHPQKVFAAHRRARCAIFLCRVPEGCMRDRSESELLSSQAFPANDAWLVARPCHLSLVGLPVLERDVRRDQGWDRLQLHHRGRERWGERLVSCHATAGDLEKLLVSPAPMHVLPGLFLGTPAPEVPAQT